MPEALVLLPVFAGLLVFVGVGRVRRFAVAHRILDVPNERSSHRVPVPRGGGIPIAIVGLLALAGLAGAGWLQRREAACLLFGAGSVAAVGWWDDVRSLPVRIRLIVHSLAAAAVVAGVGSFHLLEAAGRGGVEPLGLIVTFLWIVGLTNAYNFMDGIDGIAGAQGAVAASAWAWAGMAGGNRPVMILGLVVAGACFGFLVHNWSPAKVFMGDVGSGFLGFLLASVPLMPPLLVGRDGLVEAGVVVWPFVFDSGFTFTRRLLRGENVFLPHRTHLYQRLVITGLPHRTVAGLYAAMAALGCVAFEGLRNGWISRHIVVFGIALAAAALVALVLLRERSAAHRLE